VGSQGCCAAGGGTLRCQAGCVPGGAAARLAGGAAAEPLGGARGGGQRRRGAAVGTCGRGGQGDSQVCGWLGLGLGAWVWGIVHVDRGVLIVGTCFAQWSHTAAAWPLLALHALPLCTASL
jgi:hypothetical protein